MSGFFRLAALPLLLPLLLPMQEARAGDGNLNKASDVVAIGLPLVAAGISLYMDDQAGLWQLAKSEAVTLGVTEVLKRSVHEMRPNGQDDQSFPSRHASVSFAAAQYMQMRGGWQYGVPAYLAAGLVGYARVQAHEHYWKDVAAGALIGIGASYYFTDSRDRSSFGISSSRSGTYAYYNTRW